MTPASKTPPSHEVKSFFLIMAAAPVFLGLYYNLVFYFFFIKEIHLVFEHFLSLGFWIVSTTVISAVLFQAARSFGGNVAVRLAALVPAFSYFSLFFIYLCALIGNLNWGSIPTYETVLWFFPNIFTLVDELMIPRIIPVLVLSLPLAGLVAFYQWKTPELSHGMERLKKHPWPKKKYLLLSMGTWMVVAVALYSDNPYVKLFGHFKYDPLIRFFKSAQLLFSMTNDRILRADEDKLAEQSLQRRTPRFRNVLIFVVDALRADHLPLYGYPRPLTPYLQRLSRSSSFRKIDWALANGCESISGEMALLASKEMKDISHLNFTLPDCFSKNGFKVFVYYSGDSHWVNFKNSWGKRIDVFVDDSIHTGPAGINDDRVILEQLDNLPPDDGGRHFFYIHLMSVHEAGYVQEKYLKYRPVVDYIAHFFRETDKNYGEELQESVNMYDDSVFQADDIIRQAMEKFRAKGYLKDYLAALTSDHGQLLGEKGRFGHGRFVDEEILHIPLLFFGSKSIALFPQSHFADEMDLAPTLADAEGLAIPFSWQGQSLLRERKNPWSYHFTPSTRRENQGAVVYYDNGRILKYSRSLTEPFGPLSTEAVFDVTQDPHERKNLIGAISPTLLQQMRRQARDHFVPY